VAGVSWKTRSALRVPSASAAPRPAAGQAVGGAVHQEQRHAVLAARRDHEPVGFRAVVDQHLAAGQQPGLAPALGAGIGRERREAAVAFGPGERQAGLAGNRGLQGARRRRTGGGAGQQRRGQDGAGQERFGAERGAGALHQQHGFFRPQAQAAVVLRHRQSQPAQFTHGLPGLGGGARGLAQPFEMAIESVGGRKVIEHACADHLLFFGEVQVHGVSLLISGTGSWRSRSSGFRSCRHRWWPRG
jgi:hypothetical protein